MKKIFLTLAFSAFVMGMAQETTPQQKEKDCCKDKKECKTKDKTTKKDAKAADTKGKTASNNGVKECCKTKKAA